MGVVLLVFFIMIIYNMKIYTKDKFNYMYLSNKNMKSIRGILALLIVICHTFYYLKIHSSIKIVDFLLQSLIGSGYLAVGVFFFISGYGIMYGYLNKRYYLDKFLSNRIIKILIPFIVTNILYILGKVCIGNKYSFKEILVSFFNCSIMPNSWYMIVILIFYTTWYIIFCKYNKKTAIILISVFVFSYMILAYMIELGKWWYVSCAPFVIGIVWCNYCNLIFNFFRKNYFKVLPILISLFCISYKFSIIISYLINKNITTIIEVLTYILSTITFSIILIMLLMKLKFDNHILNFYGDISLELYLIHNLVIIILGRFGINNNFIFTILVFILSTILAILLNKIFITINKIKIYITNEIYGIS